MILPDTLRLIDSLKLFKSNLKTHLFKAAFVNYFRAFYNEFIITVMYKVLQFFTYFIIKLLIYFIIYLLFYLFIADKFS